MTRIIAILCYCCFFFTKVKVGFAVCQVQAPNLTMVVNDRELTFYNSLCTFNEAENACKQHEATLVNVVSPDIVNTIRANSYFITPDCHWTGGMRLGNENWTWSNGTKPIQTFYWAVGAPSLRTEAAICQRHNGKSIEWIDLPKDRLAYHICERETSLIVNGLTVMIYNKRLNYSEAKMTCRSLNASLVNVKSKVVQDALKFKVNDWITNNLGVSVLLFWTGGEKNRNGTWSWSDGSEIAVERNASTFQNWDSGYPEDLNGTNALFLLFRTSSKNTVEVLWFNSILEYDNFFICQKDINECDTTNNCSANATCHNTEGSYSCICMDGYVGDGIVCRDYCYEEMLNNYTFPSTKLNDTAFSTERCQNGTSIASIRCERLVRKLIKVKAGFNESSLKILECDEGARLNLREEPQFLYFQQQLIQLNMTNSSLDLTSTFDSLSLLVDAATKQGNQISIKLFEVAFELQSMIVEKATQNTLKLPVEQKQTIVKLLSAFTRLVEVEPNSTEERDSDAFFIQIATRKKSFSPSYSTIDGKILQPVVLTLPNDAFRLNNADNHSSFILYKSSLLFPSDDNVTVVVSAEVGGDDSRKELKEPVSIRFLNTGAEYGKHKIANRATHVRKTRLRCVFWDFNTTSWSDDGCFLNLKLTSNTPECLCNHLTNFALIVTSEYTLSDVALEIISVVGSALSMAGLVLTIVTNTCSREIRQRRPTKIILNISCNLFVVYLVFVAGVSQTSNKIGCDVVAMILHYFLLTSWCWMVVYSYDIYVMIVKVQLQPKKISLKQLSTFVYGIPALIVAITAGITLGYVDRNQPNYLYGSVSDPLLESSYRADYACWLRNYSLYFGFLLPMGMMLLFNVIVFILIFQKMSCTKNKVQLNASGKRTTKMTLEIAITMTSMMGITWLLGYFILITRISLYVTITSWLFAIFNTLQGVAIFLLTVVRRPELRKIWTDSLCVYPRS